MIGVALCSFESLDFKVDIEIFVVVGCVEEFDAGINELLAVIFAAVAGDYAVVAMELAIAVLLPDDWELLFPDCVKRDRRAVGCAEIEDALLFVSVFCGRSASVFCPTKETPAGAVISVLAKLYACVVDDVCLCCNGGAGCFIAIFVVSNRIAIGCIDWLNLGGACQSDSIWVICLVIAPLYEVIASVRVSG